MILPQWGLPEADPDEDTDYLVLNLGPHHTGTHGVIRFVLQLDGEEIRHVVPDIGFHHRGAEKMAERQTWHTYIPYTDRIDYLGGVMNNFAYVLAVEKLAGVIEVPSRAQVIRVMLAELFRLASHLVWLGTFAADIGAMSPVLFTFNDRERIFDIVEAITGGRMHPSFFRMGGVALDLPDGWDRLVRDFLDYLPKRLREYDRVVIRNRIFKARTKGVGAYYHPRGHRMGGYRSPDCGPPDWNGIFGKNDPTRGMNSSNSTFPQAFTAIVLTGPWCAWKRCVRACASWRSASNGCPGGSYKAEHPLAVPPVKDRTLHDIETLIHHFVNVAWGPVIPAGEAHQGIEATKGNNGYYLISDGAGSAYRCRIRTPSFPHLQMVPLDQHARRHGGGFHGHFGGRGFCLGGYRPLKEERMAISPHEQREIEALLHTYPTRRAVALEALKIVQEPRKWVTDEDLKDVAALLEMTPAELDSLATFYSQIFRRPVGEHVIRLCDGVSCWIMGETGLEEQAVPFAGYRPGRNHAGPVGLPGCR